MLWTALIAPISSLLGTWQKNRAEATNARHEANLERIRSSNMSLKDEIVLAVWCWPFVSGFIPYFRPNTIEAFTFINTLPDWYVGGFIAISLAVFGVDKIPKFKR
jgi:hypothetical protein